MKKVLFYINTIGKGGAERVMVNIAGQLAGCGYQTILVTSYPIEEEYSLHPAIKRMNLEVIKGHQGKIKRNLDRIIKLRKICKAEKPELLVAFMAEPNIRTVIATLGLPVRTIVSVRNDPGHEYSGILGMFVGKWLLPLADGCVFQTKEAMKWFPKRLQKKSTIICNPVAGEFYQIDRTPIPGRVVTCGRLVEQKNHALLIRAFSNVVKKIPEATLFIYGEGHNKAFLQKEIDALNLQGSIFLMGSTKDVSGVLTKADVFVLSSDYEGMPNALMEALAAGVPSVSTDCPCGGPAMLIRNQENGVLIPVDNESALTDAIVKIIANKEYACRISQMARESARAYSLDHVFQNWMDYMNTVAR